VLSGDSDHQAPIEPLLGLKESGLNGCQIAEKLNDEAMTSWNGKNLF